ncbi:MAG TPA: hypothetical protein VGX26_07790, partial [Solirubrobacteraceae bacterium]|nr:hypothetical protein [Solirubrobacteraceae bacterium]
DITALGSGEDDIDRQLKQLSSQPAVDDDLAKMKAELGSGAHPPDAAPQISPPVPQSSGDGAPTKPAEGGHS